MGSTIIYRYPIIPNASKMFASGSNKKEALFNFIADQLYLVIRGRQDESDYKETLSVINYILQKKRYHRLYIMVISTDYRCLTSRLKHLYANRALWPIV